VRPPGCGKEMVVVVVSSGLDRLRLSCCIVEAEKGRSEVSVCSVYGAELLVDICGDLGQLLINLTTRTRAWRRVASRTRKAWVRLSAHRNILIPACFVI
jgi:hypothetical protein